MRQAKKQSDESERQASLGVERERELLRQTLHTASVMKALVGDRQLVMEVLEREEVCIITMIMMIMTMMIVEER